MKAGLRIEGLDDMDRNLRDLERMADREQLGDLGADALQPVADSARGMARQRTGRLARSIGVGQRLSPAQAVKHQPEAGTVEIYVGPGSMPQAITEEFGTVHEAAHPYMRPAWDARVTEVIARLRAGAGARLRRITKG